MQTILRPSSTKRRAAADDMASGAAERARERTGAQERTEEELRASRKQEAQNLKSFAAAVTPSSTAMLVLIALLVLLATAVYMYMQKSRSGGAGNPFGMIGVSQLAVV